MGKGTRLRFVKTPGSLPLPDGVSRQYQVFAGSAAGEPELSFDLDKPHMRGTTWVRSPVVNGLVLSCLEKVGGGRWALQTVQGDTVAEIAGKGVLTQSWHLSFPGSGPVLELADPKSFAKQVVRTMLDGETEGLVLTLNQDPVGGLAKQHRSSGGGFLSGMKRFVQGRDWVLDLQRPAMDVASISTGHRIALLALSLSAIVSLEFSSPD
ncbi:hypothetical protein [Roseibium sediminicola]|uniref:Scramblase n=1 Tax=Roseibium sediminicola TaxID=2933272 RepID=A0ABT0GRM1_9HYPH|nr:hypothetical protein [Roseibium sp. CAU 1639]MCK7612078.1 hypothetical protein [Roseibium sp. CAU 1639]